MSQTPFQAPLIMIADDDDLLRNVVEHKLAAAGYDVVQVDNGEAVLERACKVRPAAIVLDGMMPIMDGFEALRRLKSDPDLQRTPVVMLTALRRDSDIVTALNLGAADYLVKPFSPNELIARLSKLAPLETTVRTPA